jgi:hypothetical protein
MLSTLRLLFPVGPDACQTGVVALLQGLASEGGLVATGLTEMAKQLPESLRQSRLRLALEPLLG